MFLRPVVITDKNNLYEYVQDEQVTKYLIWDVHNNIQQTIETIENIFLKRDVILLPVYAIVLQEKIIGTISIVDH